MRKLRLPGLRLPGCLRAEPEFESRQPAVTHPALVSAALLGEVDGEAPSSGEGG